MEVTANANRTPQGSPTYDLASAVVALVDQLGRSQWLTAEAIRASQFRHLGRLAEHSARWSSAFARRLAAAGLSPQDLSSEDGLSSLPPMTRREVQSAGTALYCASVPAGHGVVTESRTSGSTGEPVTVKRTSVTGVFWNAMAMRDLTWHGRDLTGRLCAIRAMVTSRSRCDGWGPPASLFARTGPFLQLPITTDTASLVASLIEFQPTLLDVYPTTLGALSGYCDRHGVAIASLQHIMTTGETLSRTVRAAAERVFAVPVADCYSSQELGYIAHQCPESGLYHTAAESLIVEVLNDAAQPCAPGEIGRVVVTDLHNYATPLVRYQTGDMAVAAAACSCGRGLPTLGRIVGRERHFIQRPDGTRHWPATGFFDCRDHAPVVQYQFVQKELDTIDLHLVAERPLSRGEEEGLTALFASHVGYPFNVRFTYYRDRIPAGPSGKFEDFICELPAGISDTVAMSNESSR